MEKTFDLYSFPCGPFQTNALLLISLTTKEAAIIDPSPGSAYLLLDKADALGVTITKILLTHSHWDHIADVYTLRQRIDVPVYIHRLDAPNLSLPGSDGLPLFFSIRGVEPDEWLEEGDIVTVGDLTAEVIHTPGHSPGGVCYFFRQEGLLISGDTLFAGAIGNLALPTSEPPLMQHSLAKLAALPKNTRVVPGHGPETTIGREEITLSE